MKRTRLVLLLVFGMLAALLPLSTVAAVATDHGACGDPFTPIYDIQGDGDESPYDGDTVVTEGVVTVAHQANANEIRGFFIQDPYGDGDAATSDGIFVSHGDAWSPSFVVSVGDHVRIMGSVDEQFGSNTQIEFLDEASKCGFGMIDPTKVDARSFTANAERFEGMLVEFKHRLAVTDTYNLATNGEVWLAEKTVVPQPTEIFAADDDRAGELGDDSMARSVLLDDGIRFRNPHDGTFLNENGTLRLGDEIFKLTGAVWFDFFQYRVIPNRGDVDIRVRNARPDTAPAVGGQVVVGSANVLNFWTTLGGRGADTPEQLAVQTEKLVAEILGLGADIVGLQEMENDPDNVPAMTLVAALNTAEGADVWSWVEGFSQNIYPISNEIIYRNDRVTPYRDPMSLASPAFDDFRFGVPSPDNQLGRRPVAQGFEVDGEVFTVVVNHFKSKSPTGATGDDADQGDGQAAYNARRVMQAKALLDWLDYLTAANEDPDVLVVGDLNSYMEEDPVLELETELVNLVEKYDPKHYSYNFFDTRSAPWIGRGTLDHAFASSSMAKQVTRTQVWHINADEPRFLDWFDPTVTAPGPFRASDHDPVLIGLALHSKKGK